MKLTIDRDNSKLLVEDGGESRELDLYTREAFELASDRSRSMKVQLAF